MHILQLTSFKFYGHDLKGLGLGQLTMTGNYLGLGPLAQALYHGPVENSPNTDLPYMQKEFDEKPCRSTAISWSCLAT